MYWLLIFFAILPLFASPANEIYRFRLKALEFDKEAPQNFCSERATIAERQGVSENENYGVKPTRSKRELSNGTGIYCRRSETLILGSSETRTNQSEALRMRKPFPDGKGDEENRLGKVVASPKSKFQADGSITPSTPDEIFSLTSDLLVNGIVSASSGQLALSETDLHVRGAQDLVFKRIYIPPHILGRYEEKEKLDGFFLGQALSQLNTKGWVAHPHLWAGYNEHSPYFQVRDPRGFTLEFEIQGNHGILKTSSQGCTNFCGNQPNSAADIRNIELCIEGIQVKLICPDGTHRYYSQRNPGDYFLEKEVLSNGKAIRYEYDERGLLNIFSSDLTGKYTYASIARVGEHRYRASDGREVNFVYEVKEIKGERKEGKYSRKNVFLFPVVTKAFNSTYANTMSYNERLLLHSYDAKAYPISCTYFQQAEVPARIQTLSTPSGSITFSYDPAVAGQKKGSTTVSHPDGTKTIYRFNQRLLLEAIEKWLGKKLIYKKTFEYDYKQHIKSMETFDGEGNLILAKRFECDRAGNPIWEQIEGDFGVFDIQRMFDKNRLRSEIRSDGLKYEFSYVGDTWLVASKIISDSKRALRTTTYTYDDAYHLIQEEDEVYRNPSGLVNLNHSETLQNAQNLTVHGIAKIAYTLYQTAPHLHRVEWEEKTDGEGQLIYKIHYCYDAWGNVNEEQYFGSDGILAYTIARTYNEKGELLNETNAIGEVAVYTYDIRGRCIYEEPCTNNLIIQRNFDAKGRLISLHENDHETRFSYNTSDELIEKTDYLGYRTQYYYDSIHGKPNLVVEPSAITKITHDAVGGEQIELYEAKTVKSYNSYGSILSTTYPEGGQESFSYFPNGSLQSHTDPDGLITTYTYDVLGRTTKKTVGELTTTFHYDHYHPSEIIDPAGFTTEYKYDGAGRKIEERRDNRIIQYGYDALGFLAWEKRGKDWIEYTNDALGRLQRQSLNGLLETSWTYDRGGNLATIEQEGMITFTYDAHNRLTEKTDLEGHKISICYEEKPQMLVKKRIDHMGVETIQTYHPQGHLLKQEMAGKIIGEYDYDLAFRLIRQNHLAFGCTFDEKKRWSLQAEPQVVNWTYTPGNRCLTKQESDGTVLSYEYDAQWRVKKIGTRDFQYDALDRVIGGSGFLRQLDAFGNIIREEWANGFWTEVEYDDWGRPLIKKFADQTRIKYEYTDPFVTKVTRVSKDGKEVPSLALKNRKLRKQPEGS